MNLTNDSFDSRKSKTNELLEHLINIISKDDFLNKKNPNREIPFYICPFMPASTLEVYDVINYLKKQLDKREIEVYEIDLYEISIAILKDMKGNLFEKIRTQESQMEKDDLLETLQNVLNAEDHLVPEIQLLIKNKKYQVLFIKGIGEVFPYIRAHNLLTNLQKILKNQPTIIFFPGNYENDPKMGFSFNLFCELSYDNYYRALNILKMR